VTKSYYSFGVILYELLTGELPFSSADPLEIIHAHIAKKPVPPAVKNRNIPSFLSEVVLHLLAKNPEDRYQSAEGIVADLELCIEQLEPGAVRRRETRPSVGEHDTPLWFEISSKLYGRDNELAAIRRSIDLVVNGDARIVLMAGPAGFGKTSLIGEIGGLLIQHRLYVGSGKFEQLAGNTPYSAIIQAMQALVRRMLTEAEQALTTWRQRLEGILGRSTPLIVDLIPELETLFGPQPPLGEVGPLEARARLHFVFKGFLQSIAVHDHPLALFLDDLQWADAASLQLLESLFLDGSMQHLILLGTYRDNELDASRPAASTLRRLQEDSCCETVRLSPLGIGSVAAMLSDALNVSPAAATEIAELCVERCAGNPLLIRELVTSLVEAGIIRPDRTGTNPAQRWEWDIAEIRRSPLTEDAARLISQRISGLAEPAHHLVRHAACIGIAFRLSHLARAAGVPLVRAARLLRDVIAADIVYVAPEDESKFSSLTSESQILSQLTADTDVTLSFRHDLLLQAAYAAIPPEELPQMHLKVGQALRSLYDDTEVDNVIFSLLSQLNQARPLLMSTNEARRDLAQLNLAGGKRAAASSAHEAALGYFDFALALFSDAEPAWVEHHELLAELHLHGAEAACVAGALARSDALIDAALHHTTSVVERVNLLKVQIIQRTLAGRCAEALVAGSEALMLLGTEPLPPAADLSRAVQQKLAWIDEQLRARPVASLRATPIIDNAEARTVGELLAAMNAPAYFTSPEHVGWVATSIVESSLRHGSTPASAMGYVTLGNIFANLLGRHREGFELGQLGLETADQFNDGVSRCRTRLIFANNYFCWVRPIRASFAINDEGFCAGIESGDLPYAGYIQMFRLYQPLSAGEPLTKIEALIPTHMRFCRKTNNQLMCDVIEGLQAVLLCLRGATPGPLFFALESRPEQVYLDEWRARSSGMALGKFHALKSMTLYLHADYEGAFRCAGEAKAQEAFTFGQYTNVEALHYGSLSLVKLAARASGQERTDKLAEVARRQEQMKTLAELCPANFLHGYLLVEAELAGLRGERWEAAQKYNDAIRLASENRFAQSAAIANELAGRFWLAAGWPQYGEMHLQKAHRGYVAWGALRKAGLLEADFAFLEGAGGGVDARSAPSLTDGRAGLHFNLASILKATAAVSSILVERELHERLLRIAAENAGAKRGSLIVHRDEQWVLEAEIDVPQDRVQVGIGVPLSSAGVRLPQSVINYVRRLKTAVVLEDTRQSENFALDPYYAGDRAVSVLCVPILRQSAVTAILYLDNDLVTGAFRQDQVEILRILTSQAASALDNAQLYEKLNRLNLDLKARYEDAQEAVRVKSEFVANVSHELRTPLNGLVNIPESLLRDFRTTKRFLCRACGQAFEDNGDGQPVGDTGEAPPCPACHGGLTAQDTIRFVGIASEHHFFLQQMSQAAGHLRHLVSDLLDFSQLEAGRMQLELKPFAVRELFSEVSERVQRQVAEKGITVTFIADEPLSLEADRGKLGQVLLNLIENAIKFTPNRHPITVTAVPGDLEATKVIHFAVTDRGIGIPADKLEEIFESFKQVDGSHTRAHGGVGLGLALCRRIVGMHWGRIWAESRLGEGSTIHVELPVEQTTRASSPQNAEPPSGTRVLLIDDDPAYLELASRVLREAGYAAHTVIEPRDALDAIRRLQPSAVILDVMMPRVNGLSILERLKANPDTRELPVLISTAYHDNREAAIKLGACWVPKPWRASELLAALGATLAPPPTIEPAAGAPGASATSAVPGGLRHDA